MKFIKNLLIIFFFILISCYANNRAPRELVVEKVEYYEDYQGYYLRVYTDLESGKYFGVNYSKHFDWENICSLENNEFIGEDYSEYFTFAIQIKNQLNPVADKGKLLYFTDKIFTVRQAYDSTTYEYCYITTVSKEITF